MILETVSSQKGWLLVDRAPFTAVSMNRRELLRSNTELNNNATSDFFSWDTNGRILDLPNRCFMKQLPLDL